MNSEHSKVAVVTGSSPWIQAITSIATFLISDVARHVNDLLVTADNGWMVEWA